MLELDSNTLQTQCGMNVNKIFIEAVNLCNEVIQLKEKNLLAENEEEPEDNDEVNKGGELKSGHISMDMPETGNIYDWYKQNQGKVDLANQEVDMESDSDDSDWDAEDDEFFKEGEEEFEYDSPLDVNFCPILYLKTVMEQKQARSQQEVDGLVGGLSNDVRNGLPELFRKGEEFFGKTNWFD